MVVAQSSPAPAGVSSWSPPGYSFTTSISNYIIAPHVRLPQFITITLIHTVLPIPVEWGCNSNTSPECHECPSQIFCLEPRSPRWSSFLPSFLPVMPPVSNHGQSCPMLFSTELASRQGGLGIRTRILNGIYPFGESEREDLGDLGGIVRRGMTSGGETSPSDWNGEE